MKFLIFNAVVAAALFYLFTADRDELRATADRVYDGARAIEERVEDFTEEHEQAFASEESSMTSSTPDHAANHVEPAQPAVTGSEAPNAPTPALDAAPSVTTEAPRDPDPSPSAEDFFATVVAEEGIATLEAAEAPKKPEPLAEMSVAELPVHPVPDQPALDGLPPVSDPDVARRRAEVLEGVAGTARPASSPAVVIPEGTELMSPDERLRALYDLAEEMELLAVTKIHR
jgi:hypothetical protein